MKSIPPSLGYENYEHDTTRQATQGATYEGEAQRRAQIVRQSAQSGRTDKLVQSPHR